MRKNKHEGSTLDSLFEELGELEEVRALAQKKIIAIELRRAMKQRKVSFAQLARTLGTSRSAVHRILDPDYTGSTFESIAKISSALGKRLTLTDEPKHTRRAA